MPDGQRQHQPLEMAAPEGQSAPGRATQGGERHPKDLPGMAAPEGQSAPGRATPEGRRVIHHNDTATPGESGDTQGTRPQPHTNESGPTPRKGTGERVGRHEFEGMKEG